MTPGQDKQTTIATVIEVDLTFHSVCRMCCESVGKMQGVKVVIETAYHDPPKWFVACDGCASSIEAAWEAKKEYIQRQADKCFASSMVAEMEV